ncbi:MAG: hypothetical protein WA941_23735 [Nitrososphaeraceae archaeon]
MNSKPFSLKTTTLISGLIILSMVIFSPLYTFKVSLATTTPSSNGAKEFSAAITDARDQFEDELMTQGRILVDNMRNAFNIESVQSPLNLAYQYAFTGNISEAKSELQMAASELDSLIINLTRAGQQMAAISQDRSFTADNSTRQMIAGLGDALTQLGISANELKQNLPTD